MITPVILCGGVGSRLWPLSREDHPKQFLKVNGKHSLFQETILRCTNKEIFSNPIVVCGEKYKFKVASELEEINVKPHAIILEPCSRNTAPAITAASLLVGQPTDLLVLPADHVIEDKETFVNYIKNAKPFTKEGLITFGIVPEHPATGYGYIKMGDRLNDGIFHVESFTEKPNQSTAETFIKEGKYFWNSGIFLLNSQLYLKEAKELTPDLLTAASKALSSAKKTLDFIRLNEDEFAKIEDISIDNAIFEKTTRALVYPVNLNWADLGNWKSLYTHMQKDSDESGNVIVGKKVFARECSGNLIHSSESNSHVIANKVDNLCIINTHDTVLITDKDHTEDVKAIYSSLKKQGLSITKSSQKHYRPWGYYEIILDDTKCKVKRIHIFPLQNISLQYHNHRDEHWVITRGTATVTKGDETFQLNENEYVYILAKENHKISNDTQEPIEFVEVQIGEVLEEEDIVRLEDKYGRVSEAQGSHVIREITS